MALTDYTPLIVGGASLLGVAIGGGISTLVQSRSNRQNISARRNELFIDRQLTVNLDLMRVALDHPGLHADDSNVTRGRQNIDLAAHHEVLREGFRDWLARLSNLEPEASAFASDSVRDAFYKFQTELYERLTGFTQWSVDFMHNELPADERKTLVMLRATTSAYEGTIMGMRHEASKLIKTIQSETRTVAAGLAENDAT